MSFRDRLNRMLDGRALTAWGKRHQLSGGTISRMSQGIPPGQQILSLIQKIENVSIDWLVEGTGQPFVTHRMSSDRQAAEYIRELLAEGGWDIYLVTDGRKGAVVMAMPGEVIYKGKRIPYTVVEVITGPIGPVTLGILKEGKYGIGVVPVDEFGMQDIESGQMGTYALFGDGEQKGLVASAHMMTDISPRQLFSKRDLKVEEPSDEQLLYRFHQLSQHDQETVRMIIDALLTKRRKKG